jgi:glycolate oxidase FAD binding subunit
MPDCKDEIATKIKEAYKKTQPLKITAGGSKHFYGRNIQGEPLSLSEHTGVIEYEPSELYITARSGTSLLEIEQTISNQHQILPCESPHFGKTATLGGMIACGLAGPRRANAGSVRDCILGTDVLNGKGEYLHFGGRVMKNVAGYDVSRLMCGALGTLGVVMSATLRLLPKPACEQSIAFTVDSNTAITKMNQWANSPMPISASFYDGKELYIRLSGSATAIESCKNDLGGELIDADNMLWNEIKEHTHHFFTSDKPLWRVSVPPSIENLNISGNCAIEWNGALRWYSSDADETAIRSEAERVGGHACLFKGDVTEQIFHPVSETSMKLHKKLKQTLDPAGILNPGKMFAEL